MFTRFDANKSTKGASKLRRDLINAEIANLRDLLPLPPSTRQRLSQLQLMALVCVYVRKANYFQQAFKRHDIGAHQSPTPNIGFSKALSGFLMMMTQNGKLLYISDNAAEYLGHSMEDLLIHGDSVYDIIDKQDHQAIQTELGRSSAGPGGGAANAGSGTGTVPVSEDSRMFLCRMNVSRNARRQMRFGDQKVVLVRGHYLSFLPLCSRNEPVFLATCTPIAMPETRECVVQGATNVFTSIHSMDMKFVHLDKNGEFHLGYGRTEVQGASWYRLLHWDSSREAQAKHRLITQSEQDRSCILLVRLQRRNGDWLWAHCVLQVKENMENSQQPVIVCTNQVLSEREAAVMRTNGWLYHYYMVQSKLQYGLAAYDAHTHAHAHATSRMVAYYQHGSQQHEHQHQQQGQPPPPPPPPPQQQPQPYLQHHQQPHQPHQPHQQQHGGRADAEPVDYSVHASHPPTEPVPPYGKRKPKHVHVHNLSAVLELEPLKISESARSSPSAVAAASILDLDRAAATVTAAAAATATATSTSVLLMPALQLRPRLMVKASLATLSANASATDTTDFMEQWNPSPPWSDTLQKVPDMTHQDLSPYVTTTPPTPTGTPGASHTVSSAFTFDWMPEQYVPSLAHRAHSVADADDEPCGYLFQQQTAPLCWLSTNTSTNITSTTTVAAAVATATVTTGDECAERVFTLQPPPAPRSTASRSSPAHSL